MHALIHLGLVPNTNHPKLSETRSNLKVETTASEVRVLRPQLLNHRHYYRISNQSFPLYAHGPARCELAKKKEKKAVEKIKKKKRKEGGKEIGSCRSVARLHYLRE